MSEAAAYQANKQYLAQAIENLGITDIKVSFEGGGDSGQIDYIDVKNQNGCGVPNETQVMQVPPYIHSFNHTTRRWERASGEPQLGPLETLIESIVNYELNQSGVDWYNNEGGFGTWELFKNALTDNYDIQFDVNVRVIESTNEWYSDQVLEEWVEDGSEDEENQLFFHTPPDTVERNITTPPETNEDTFV